jgi:hypothetical protein
MRAVHVFAGGIIALLAGATWFALQTEPVPLHIPPNWRPWADVELDQEPTVLARFQLRRLTNDSEACFEALDRSNIEYSQLPDRPLERGCGIEARTHVVRSHYAYSSGFEASCGLVAALYWYEQRLTALAQEYLKKKIARIEHYGTFACRNIYNRAEARRSAHATGRAIDIAGFRLDDGTAVSILRDWDADNAEGRFLTAARDEACRFFPIVLSPDYNKAHANHFHLETGGFGLCR